MMNDEMIIHQLSAFQQSVEMMLQIHVTWFAFTCTINATAIALILGERLRMHTRIFPWMFIYANTGAAVSSILMILHYQRCSTEMSKLLEEFNQQPAVSIIQLHVASVVIALVCVGMSAGWMFVAKNWERYSHGQKGG